jgi:calcineurin-like phosphoesterase family protein
MYFFTADQHFGHFNIIKYCNRPYTSVDEMDNDIITNYNKVVYPNDIVVHGGDLTLIKDPEVVYNRYISKLNGKHIFLKGNHDRWNKSGLDLFSVTIEGIHIVVSHYAMRVWNRSHYNAWNLYGHSHGKLPPIGKQHDIGVDNNGFFPMSFAQIKAIMEVRDNNPNFIGDK